MLKKPYKLVAKEDKNNYYLIDTQDTMFLAVESVLNYGNKEFIQGLKLMPIYAPVMMLFIEMMKMEKIGEKVIEGLGKEEFFETIKVKKVREKIAELTNVVTEESMCKYTDEIKSFALRRFIDEEEYEVLAIETKSQYRRNVWLAKSDKFGTLRLSIAGVFGKETQKFTILDTYVFNKQIISQVILEINKIELKKKKKEYKEFKRLQKIMKNKKVEEKK